MSLADITYVPESAAHDPEIEDINAEAFGPGRYARAAYRIREGGPHLASLSFAALKDGAVVASVRMTPIAAGEGRALLLGPLAVRPAFRISASAGGWWRSRSTPRARRDGSSSSSSATRPITGRSASRRSCRPGN